MKNKIKLLMFLLSLVILSSFSFAAVVTEVVYSYDFETSAEISNYTLGSDWARDESSDVSAQGGSWLLYWSGGSTDTSTSYNNNFVGGEYDWCELSAYFYIESSFDTGEYVCVDYSTDGSTYNANSGGGTALCIDGNNDDENSWVQFSYNFTSPTDTMKWRFRASSSANSEDGGVDTLSMTCAYQVPSWTNNLTANSSVSIGEDITYTATGTYSSNYILRVCDSDSITSGACGSSSLCNSTSTASGVEASCLFTTASVETLIGYGFLCDASNLCGDSTAASTLVNSTYGDINVSLIYPLVDINTTTDSLFYINASINCLGSGYDACGVVSAYPRYNASSAIPDTNISMFDTTPFWTDANVNILDGFNKAVPIIVNTTQSVSFYELLINITYDSDMQSDFDDLRFTTLDNLSFYNYWIEEQVDSSWASVWVQANISSDNGTQLYLWYGNSDASNNSNASNTFILYDDFTTYNENIWNCTVAVTGVCEHNSAEGYMVVGTGDQDTADTKSALLKYDGYDLLTINSMIESRNVRITDASFGDSRGCSWSIQAGDAANANYIRRAIQFGDESYFNPLWVNNGTLTNPGDVGTGTPDGTWKISGLDWHLNAGVRTFLVIDDGVLKYTANDANVPGTEDTFGVWVSCGSYGAEENLGTIYVDWVRIRKHIVPEPAVSLETEITSLQSSVNAVPQSQYISNGEQFNVSWIVNASGENGSWLSNVFAESSYGESSVTSNVSDTKKITIGQTVSEDISFTIGYPSSGCSNGFGCSTGGCTACTYCCINGTSETFTDINCTGQTSGVSFYIVTNTGDTTFDVTMAWNESISSDLSGEVDLDNAPAGSTGLTTSAQTICSSITTSNTCTIWMWGTATSATPDTYSYGVDLLSSQS